MVMKLLKRSVAERRCNAAMTSAAEMKSRERSLDQAIEITANSLSRLLKERRHIRTRRRRAEETAHRLLIMLDRIRFRVGGKKS